MTTSQIMIEILYLQSYRIMNNIRRDYNGQERRTKRV